MITFNRNQRRCDGVSRRDALAIGSLSAFGLSLFSGAGLLANQAAVSRPKNCILVWLDGGPSHLELFDPKPEMPAEIRGPLSSIATTVPGIRYGECLPRLAQRLSQMTLVRSLSSPLGEHNLGAHYLLTGYKPSPNINYPVFGSVAQQLRPSKDTLPGFVAIPHHSVGGAGLRANGFLPTSVAPFELNPSGQDKKLAADQLTLLSGLTSASVQRRAEYLQMLDQFSRSADRIGGLPNYIGLDQAVRLLTSPDARAAFDLEAESSAVRQNYGSSMFGQSCLLTRRLVERGVSMVTVNYSGWDTHDNLVVRLKDGYAGAREPVGLIPNLDQGLAALHDDLNDRGLLSETLVVVMGEFGRTPKINPQGGRDHWPRAFSVLLAGGGTPQGLVFGETDHAGESVKTDPVSPADLVATIYKLLGFDPQTELITPEGRPIRIGGEGTVVGSLIA